MNHHYNFIKGDKMKRLNLILILFVVTAATAMAQERPVIAPAPKFSGDLRITLQQMSEEEEKEYLKSLDPEQRADLEEIKKLNKERYYDLLREAHFTRFDFPFIGKREKEEKETEKKIVEYNISTELLGLKYQKANDSEKSKIKSELIKKLGELFELKELQRKNEVAQLQKELEELKKSLEVRKNNKDAIVQKRFNELTGVGDYLDWD